MLEVLQEYFTSPDSVEDEDDLEEVDDLDEGLTHLEDSLTVTLEGIDVLLLLLLLLNIPKL